MKRLFLIFTMIAGLHAQDVEVETQQVPASVTAAAVKAVGDLGREVALGKFKIAVERMYPQWKERAAKRAGGMDKLERKLDDVSKEMLARGMSITDCFPKGEPRSFEVYPGKAVEVIDGKKVEKLRYTKWLILVPTVTKFRVFLKDDPVAVNIESTGFQVAICDKDKEEWTFIDGSGVTVNELRSLFITLPQDLELPPLEKKQIR